MRDSSQTIPLVTSLDLIARRRAEREIAERGCGLPAKVISVNGALVTIGFLVDGLSLPNVTCPIAGSAYVRIPVQVGDLGVAFPAGYSIAQVSGMGPPADDTPAENMSALMWHPCGSQAWSSVDANAVTVNGPNGVVLRDTDSKSTVTLTPSGINASMNSTYELTAADSIKLTVGSHSIVIDSSGITIDGKDFLTHEHQAGTYVVDSSAVTGISGAVE